MRVKVNNHYNNVRGCFQHHSHHIHIKRIRTMKYTKSATTLALIAAVGLSLSACGGAASSSPGTPSVEALNAAPATSSAAPQGETSERGNLVKKFGQSAGMFNPENNKPTVNFTFNKITLDAPCTGPYPQPAENGHIAVIDVSVETFPELGAEKYGIKKFDISSASFKFIGSKGTTFNGNLGTMGSFSCLPDDQVFPQNGVGPAEKATGKVVLDLPEKSGVLVFKDLFGQASWEYKF